MTYAYQNNSNSCAYYLFNNNFYSENDEKVKELAVQYYDKKTYQSLFFKKPHKDKISHAIALGSVDVLNSILKNEFYSLYELRKIFRSYCSFLLLGRTDRDENERYTFIYSNTYSRKTFFSLMKYLVETDNTYNYVEEFLIEIKLSLKEVKIVRPYLDHTLVNILGGLLRQIPQAKAEALPFFLSLQPDNAYFIKLEKKGLESFLMHFEKQETKEIKKDLEKDKINRRKI
jgi:hypothetical protein